ncbi:MAG: hypothetical protein IKU48_06205, partial [Clostridia bacterium]|nr:hypothetical protein [Clostridia bacterium]
MKCPTHAPLPYCHKCGNYFSLPCVKGGGTACRDGGIVKTYSNNPSVSFADSSPYTEEPTAAAG